MRKVSLAILISTLILAVQGYAQNITGSMSGRVVDQQGAVVPGATVTATEPNKKVNITAKTTQQGEFNLAGLQPGTYSVEVTATGFKKLEKTGIPLDAQDKLSLGDFVLTVGAVTESVEVSAHRRRCCRRTVWSADRRSFPSRWRISKSTDATRLTWRS